VPNIDVAAAAAGISLKTFSSIPWRGSSMVPHFPYGHSHTHTRSHTPRLSHPDRAMLWGI